GGLGGDDSRCENFSRRLGLHADLLAGAPGFESFAFRHDAHSGALNDQLDGIPGVDKWRLRCCGCGRERATSDSCSRNIMSLCWLCVFRYCEFERFLCGYRFELAIDGDPEWRNARLGSGPERDMRCICAGARFNLRDVKIWMRFGDSDRRDDRYVCR